VRCAILVSKSSYDKVFDGESLAELSAAVKVVWEPHQQLTGDAMAALAEGADVAITSWGTPRIDRVILDRAPALGLVAHAAGSVKPVVSDDLIAHGAAVTTAAPAIGIGVAEFCVGAMVMAGKRVKEQMLHVEGGGWTWDRRADATEFFRAKVGVVGAGFVGRHLIKLLKCYELGCIWVYDPYLTDQEAVELGVRKRSLENIFSECDFISINAPSTDETKGMIGRDLLKLIKPNAVFVNTARGAVVDEPALVEELKTGRFCALLDVTDPEPPAEDNPLRSLPNVVLTPHIAGAISNNLKRIGMYAVREVVNYARGEPLVYTVKLSELNRLA